MTDCDGHESEHIWIEGVGAIQVRESSNVERQQQRLNAAIADALHTPEELQRGMYHRQADVRQRVVARLIARGSEHPGTIAVLLDALQHDPSPSVRGTVASALDRFSEDDRVLPALEYAARNDPNDEVREDARLSLGETA